LLIIFFLYIEDKTLFTFLFILVVDFILIGGILPLIERKFLSLVQRRIGPYYVGYKGRFQFIADALKVFFKDFIYLNKLNHFYYLLWPFLYIYINILIFIFFYFDSSILVVDVEYYFIFIYLIIIFSNIILFLTGIFSKNKYSIISSVRVIVFIYTLDIMFTLLLIILICYGNSFNLYSLRVYVGPFGVNFTFLPLLPLILLVFLIDANKAPYDLYEAESELVMGYSIEYSGFLFGLYVLTEYLHILYFAFLISCMLF